MEQGNHQAASFWALGQSRCPQARIVASSSRRSQMVQRAGALAAGRLAASPPVATVGDPTPPTERDANARKLGHKAGWQSADWSRDRLGHGDCTHDRLATTAICSHGRAIREGRNCGAGGADRCSSKDAVRGSTENGRFSGCGQSTAGHEAIGIYAASCWSADPDEMGHFMRDAFAASRKCARREGGMPFRRQLWTVETGHWINRATALVPPSPSIMRSASVCIGVYYDSRNLSASGNCGIRNG